MFCRLNLKQQVDEASPNPLKIQAAPCIEKISDIYISF
jgi:hypothetical protein